jgi:hypothetical protein
MRDFQVVDNRRVSRMFLTSEKKASRQNLIWQRVFVFHIRVQSVGVVMIEQLVVLNHMHLRTFVAF